MDPAKVELELATGLDKTRLIKQQSCTLQYQRLALDVISRAVRIPSVQPRFLFSCSEQLAGEHLLSALERETSLELATSTLEGSRSAN